MAKIPSSSLRDQTQPARALRAVTPHASNLLPDGRCRSLFVGTGGDVTILAMDDTSAVTLKNVPDGTLLPIATKAVLTSGTTATNIVALY